MRVVTWNLGRRRHDTNEEAWTYLRDVLHADIAFVQEAAEPLESEGGHLVLKPVYLDWGTGVYARDLEIRRVPGSFDPSRIVVCEATIAALGPVFLVSLHAPTSGGRDPEVWLEQVLDSLEPLLRERSSIVGGDLNTSRGCAKWFENSRAGRLFERIDAGPLFDCHRKFHEGEERTYFHAAAKVPIQDDHIFVSKALADFVTSCHAVKNKETLGLSDHIPVVADLAIEPPGV